MWGLELKNRWLFSAFFFVFSCSSYNFAQQERTHYDAYLKKNLQQKKLFLKLKELASAQLLPVTPELRELQLKVLPGFEAPEKENARYFILSMEMSDWGRFNTSDLKVYWGDLKAKSVKEIMDHHIVRNLYPFAYPHDRVFVVEFETNQDHQGVLRLQSVAGEFVFSFIANEGGL
jgi:hypothetical protein